MPIRTGGAVGSRLVPTASAASGVWQLGEVETARRAKIWPALSTDSLFSSVALLLPMTGANNSTAFRDLSNNNFTVSVFGDAKISTTQSRFDTGSLYCDGSGDYISVPDSSQLALTGDFTVEWFQYGPVVGTIAGRWGFGSTIGWLTFVDASNLTWAEANSGTFVSTRTFAISSPAANQWHHLAVCRSGSSLRGFLNGTQVGSTLTSTSNNTPSGSTPTSIGQFQNGNYLTGYLSYLRITRAARYTAAFAAPSLPFGSPLI